VLLSCIVFFFFFFFYCSVPLLDLHSFPTRRSSDLIAVFAAINILLGRELWQRRNSLLAKVLLASLIGLTFVNLISHAWTGAPSRSEEHTSELQSRGHLVCRLLLEKKKKKKKKKQQN